MLHAKFIALHSELLHPRNLHPVKLWPPFRQFVIPEDNSLPLKLTGQGMLDFD